MSQDERIALHELRIDTLENNHKEMKEDLKQIKDVVFRLDKKLSSIPETGFQCPVHMLKMDNYSKRLESVEAKTEKLNTKIISWTAVASCILFLITQLIVPYIVQRVQIVPVSAATTVITNLPYNHSFGTVSTDTTKKKSTAFH